MTIQAREYHQSMVHYLRKDVAFTDDGATLTVGYVPGGAIVTNAYAVVTEAFDSGTSDVLDIGYAADGDEFATDVDISSVGKKAADELATAGNLAYSADTQITAAYVSAGTAPTAGAATVVVEYVPNNDD